MTVKLNFDLIKEIVAHGSRVKPNETADPSTNPILANAGVAMVTTYIEQLSLLNIVSNPSPIFGANGGMWIGYSITEYGQSLTASEHKLRMAVAELTGDAQSEVSQSIVNLREECQQASINENYKEEFLHTLEEIATCFDNGCYIAAIGLCGKILEVCLKEILMRHNIGFDPNSMIGALVKIVKEKIPSEYTDPALVNIANIINQSRITAVHARERIPIPSRDQTIMVLFAMRDIVRKYISRIPSQGG
jgi:hypothetical protein